MTAGAVRDVALLRRRRAVARLLPSLGPRWTAVVDRADALPPDPPTPPCVVVAVDDPAVSRGACVRGAEHAVPVLSESTTGVLVALAEGPRAAAAAREAARLLQPGGVALFHAVWRADAILPFDATLREAGLERLRRVAIRRTDAEPGAWAWLDARRAATAEGDAGIECVIAARRPGGFSAEMPTAGELLASIFVPRAFTAAGRAERLAHRPR